MALSVTLTVGCGPQRGTGGASSRTPALFIAKGKTKPFARPEGGLLFRQAVQIHPELLVPELPVTVRFDAPGYHPITLALQPASESLRLPTGQFAWTAVTPNGNQAFIMKIDGRVHGHVPHEGRVFRLRSVAPTRGVLEVYDASLFPQSASDTAEPKMQLPEFEAGDTIAGLVTAAIDPSCSDSLETIDLMLLYTPQAACQAAQVDPQAISEACKAPYVELASTLNTTPVEDDIYQAVGLANQALENSGLPYRLNPIYVGMAHYDENPGGVGQGDALSLMKAEPANAVMGFTEGGLPADVSMTAVEVNADLVSLVIERSVVPECGIGDTREQAFARCCPEGELCGPCLNKSVVLRGCFGAHGLAHEIGHNLGALHDRETDCDPDSEGSAYTYTLDAVESTGFNYGHLQRQPSGDAHPWVTIMSYPETCKQAGCAPEGAEPVECETIGWFSTPDLSYPAGSPLNDPLGVPIGLIGLDGKNVPPENNAQVIRYNAPIVSQNRCSMTSPKPDVWMKDYWADSGAEGAVSTGVPVWRSPYIWVRTQADERVGPAAAPDDVAGRFLHEHFHQNPIYAEQESLKRDNYVYVKLHNTGGMPEGPRSLEVYYAKPSTGLDRRDSWTLIDKVEHTMQPGTVDVVELTWSKTDIPEAGKACLLARWDTDQKSFDTLFGPGKNLMAQTRKDNDLIWRNVNIVNLGAVVAEVTGAEESAGANDGAAGSESASDTVEVTESIEVPADASSRSTFLIVTATPVSRESVDWHSLIPRIIVETPVFLSGQPSFEAKGFEGGAASTHGEPAVYYFDPKDKMAVTRLGPFLLRGRQAADVGLKLKVNRSAVAKTMGTIANPLYFDVTIMQARESGRAAFEAELAANKPVEQAVANLIRKNRVIGGVSYTIVLPPGR